MSVSMNDIKNKILSTQNMSKITKAMQLVSAAKLAKSESKVRNYRSYTQTLEAIVDNILASPVARQHPFFNSEKSDACTGYLLITSDRGLAGGYNNNVFKEFLQQLEEEEATPYKLYVLGSKGFEYGKRLKLPIENPYVFVPDEMIYTDIEPVVGQIREDYLSGKINKVVIIYNEYFSKIVQEPVIRKVLPLVAENSELQAASDYYLEPEEETIINATLLKYFNGIVYEALLKSKLSEHASRMNAMQNATDNAGEIIKISQLIYNQARQAAITQEINEIVGGASSLKRT